jgi:hypothetical protein
LRKIAFEGYQLSFPQGSGYRQKCPSETSLHYRKDPIIAEPDVDDFKCAPDGSPTDK